MTTIRSSAVVGAGWAGLAAAVALTDAGHRVVLVDAAPRVGGRARALPLDFDGETVEVDNGQHLLIGAYRETLRLIRRIGLSERQVLQRLPLRLESTDGLRLAAPRLPAPLHLAWALAFARGLPAADRIALLRTMLRLATAGWRPPAGVDTVAQWLVVERQPARVTQALWEPLCVGALNTPPGLACAATFCRVLRDSLGGTRRDSDFLLPVGTLGDVLPEPASQWLQARGATLRLRSPCRRIVRRDDAAGWRLDLPAGPLDVDDVVVAVPPANIPRLFDGRLPAGLAEAFGRFEYESIATVWLGWRGPLALPHSIMLQERPAQQQFGQWLFDRGMHRGRVRDLQLAGVVVSASGRRAALEPQRLADAVARQVATQLGCPLPEHARAIVDKRATISCTADRPRLDADALAAGFPGVWLAGDYVFHDYPATLEAAVRSGLDAAALLIARAPATRVPTAAAV